MKPRDETIGEDAIPFDADAEMLADPRWDALARGDLGDEDRAALEKLAEENPLARQAWTMFQPLGGDAEARYAARIAKEVGAHRAPAEPPAIAIVGAAPRRSLPPRRAPNVRAWIGGAVATLAMAAGFALWMRADPAAHGLPSYAIAFVGGERDDRSDAPVNVPRLGARSRFSIALRPGVEVKGPIGARVFVVQGGRAEAIEATMDRSPDGAVRLAGSLGGGTHVSLGDAEIVAVVARPEALPAPPVDAGALVEDGAGLRRILRQRVRIIEAR